MYLAKPKIKADNDINLLEYARQKDECTFQPNKPIKRTDSNSQLKLKNSLYEKEKL